MKISEDGKQVEYMDYQEYLEHHAMRRNVLSEDNPAIFAPDDHPWIVEDLKLFYKFVNPKSRILDVGCRSGWSCLRMMHDGYNNVLGVDVQADNIEFGKAWGAPIEQADAHSLAYPDKSFDAVFTRHALEHMFDPRKVIRESWRVLRSGGVFFAVVPLDSRITDFEHSHSYVFDCPQRVLEVTRIFQTVYFVNTGGEMLYVGLRSGSLAELSCARVRSTWIRTFRWLTSLLAKRRTK